MKSDTDPPFPPPPPPGQRTTSRQRRLDTQRNASTQRDASNETQREYLYATIRDAIMAEGVDFDRAHRIAWRLLPILTQPNGETDR